MILKSLKPFLVAVVLIGVASNSFAGRRNRQVYRPPVSRGPAPAAQPAGGGVMQSALADPVYKCPLWCLGPVDDSNPDSLCYYYSEVSINDCNNPYSEWLILPSGQLCPEYCPNCAIEVTNPPAKEDPTRWSPETHLKGPWRDHSSPVGTVTKLSVKLPGENAPRSVNCYQFLIKPSEVRPDTDAAKASIPRRDADRVISFGFETRDASGATPVPDACVKKNAQGFYQVTYRGSVYLLRTVR